MADRPPYLVVRGLQVWFSKRLGFLESFRRSEPAYVRAVDGVDLTVGKGEIYCLVGESGCGKTTTGRAILRLVEPTGGDVFLNPTSEEIAGYERAEAKGDADALEDFRRSRSLVYKERVRRSLRHWAEHVALVAGGGVLGILVAAGLVVGLRAAGAQDVESLAYLALGIVLAFAGTLPFLRLSRHVPHALALATIPASVAAQVLTTYAERSAAKLPSDLSSVLSAYGTYMLQNTVFVAVAEMALAALAAWYAAGVFGRFWSRRRGFVKDRFRNLRTRLQIIFQDPYESLNPRHAVYDIVSEPLLVNRITRSRAETLARVEQALRDAGLHPPGDYLFRFPHELSGGQRQRVAIARALVLDPEFLVADEPVSMLDVSIRTEIIELLLELREKKNLTYLFITHDLSLAWVLADRIGVMYLGKIVEEGPTEELIANPRHPYTKALISVVPVPNPARKHKRTILRGERPDPSEMPTGCRFHPRCPAAFERCGWTPEEVLASLRGLVTPQTSAYLEGVTVNGSRTLSWAQTSPAFEAWLRTQIAQSSPTHPALKAIRSIQRSGTRTDVVLHDFEDPALKPVSASVRVACHLFS